MTKKTFIPILSFLLLAWSMDTALCEETGKITKDEYTTLSERIMSSNSNLLEGINEGFVIQARYKRWENLILTIFIMVLYGTLFIYVNWMCSSLQRDTLKTNTDLQRQIDDLKRELEEMKKTDESTT